MNYKYFFDNNSKPEYCVVIISATSGRTIKKDVHPSLCLHIHRMLLKDGKLEHRPEHIIFVWNGGEDIPKFKPCDKDGKVPTFLQDLTFSEIKAKAKRSMRIDNPSYIY